MSDIFREVEEDVRREQLEQFWKRYGNWVIALVVLILLGVGAFQYWQYRQGQARMHDSAALSAAQRITNPREAAAAFSDLAKTAGGGYGLLAKLSQANAMYLVGQRQEAVDLYKQIGQSDQGPIGAVARLRAAWALVDTAARSQIQDLVAPLNDPGSAWHPMAQEVLAFSDYRGAKIAQAQTEYQALADDAQAPDALRTRARAMSAFLAEGGGSDFGTVPPEATPAPTPNSATPAAPAK